MRSPTFRRLLGVLVVLPLVFVVAPADANHSWGGYHWFRTSNPLSLTIADHVTTAEWRDSLTVAVGDWDGSSVLALNQSGFTSATKKCPATSGRVDVCNAWYGYNGWLGIAQIWISGGHITAGVVKLNDSYYSSATYDTPAWRNFVMCQEIGHTFGLDHQDENFNNANLGSCMDYTNDPGTNQHPNNHDFAQLADIYGHSDGGGGGGGKPGRGNGKGYGEGRATSGGGNSQAEWGQAVDTDDHGRPDLFVQELPNGDQVFTHVIWAS